MSAFNWDSKDSIVKGRLRWLVCVRRWWRLGRAMEVLCLACDKQVACGPGVVDQATEGRGRQFWVGRCADFGLSQPNLKFRLEQFHPSGVSQLGIEILLCFGGL